MTWSTIHYSAWHMTRGSALVLIQGLVSWIELNIQPYDNGMPGFPLSHKVIFYAGSFTINIDCFLFWSNIAKVKDIIRAHLEKNKHRIQTWENIWYLTNYQIDINENNERAHLITIDTIFFNNIHSGQGIVSLGP